MRVWPIVIYILCELLLFMQLWLWNEIAFAQVLFLSQLPVILLLKPFVFRGETKLGGPATMQSKVVLGLLVALLLTPFVLLSQLTRHEPSMLMSGHGLFVEGRESLLVLGFGLAAIFIMGVLIQRRGGHRWK